MDTKSFLNGQKPLVKKPLARAVGLGLAGGFILILQAWILARIATAVIIDDKGLSAVFTELMVFPLLLLVRAGLAYLSERASFEAAAIVKQHLRLELMSHLARLGPVRLAGDSAGDLVNMLTDGIEALENYYSRFLPAMSLTALLPLAILVVTLANDWLSALVMLFTAPLIPVFMIIIGKGTEKLNQRQWRKLARLSKHFLDTIQGLTTLKLFNAARREAAIIEHVSEDYRKSTMQVLRVAFLSSLVLEFFAAFSIALIAIIIGFRLLSGDMTFFHGFFVLLLAPDFYLPLRQMGTHYHARMEAVGAAERMVEVLEMEAPDAPRTQREFAAKTYDICFRDVRYSYDGERQALAGVSLHIASGKRVALVGPSGSGKSTIFNMLLGFIEPDEGHVSIGGEMLGPENLASWREKLSYAPQNPTLFKGTILDNIRLGRPDASRQDAVQAARQAEAHRFIIDLPQGYDSEIGEKGAGLSGGQIQRLAIARAILRDAPVVLLDEPTASLDLESERLVQQAIERLAEGRTSLMIAHRLSTARTADLILVADRGRIVEHGDHDQLMAKGGLYASLAGHYANGANGDNGGGGADTDANASVDAGDDVGEKQMENAQ